MKGVSVFLTLILLALAVWLPGVLKAKGKLPEQERRAEKSFISRLAKVSNSNTNTQRPIRL